MKALAALLLMPLVLMGCSSASCDSDATSPDRSVGGIDLEQNHPPAGLSPKFANIDPNDAAKRGPDGMRQARDVFHELLSRHDAIKREVENIPGGVRTVTTSDDPNIAALIQLHVRQMVARFDAGMPVRKWDPVFSELHKHYDKVNLTFEDIPGGLRVVETSEDPQVTLLIRQHAHRGVSEFVERGFDRAHEETPLPEGYKR